MLSSTLLVPLAVFYVSYLSSATGAELLKRHRRDWIIASFTVDEGYQGPFPYQLGKIDIPETIAEHIGLFGEGVDEEPKGLLFFNKTSATVYVLRPVDYEQKNKLMLKLKSNTNDLSFTMGVSIIVQDSNDNPPRFQQALYEIEVSEEKSQGSKLLRVEAQDRDEVGSPNSVIDYDIKSVSPNTQDVEFSINGSGSISFKGCLDREVAENVTIVVEAKDRGEALRLSSSTTVVIRVQDANDHVPIITGQKGSGTVKEGEVGLSPLRLLVTDRDEPRTRAWRARYTIEGDEAGNFKIETDPESNDGILTVIKPLDFERAAEMRLSIRVENELPYFSCRVKEKMQSGLWKVDTSTDAGPQPQAFKVLIKVEDANDPPEFSVGVKEVRLEENVANGTWVEKFPASDFDSTFVYRLENDPAGWLSVDPLTGDIRTVKGPDRESHYVANGVYTVLVTAVDHGDPPMTSTATLNIHVTDQNDNAPQPAVDRVDMCLSDMPVTASIPVHDPDGHPFNGPFSFELKNGFDGKWKLNSLHGYSIELVKEANVYAGVHSVTLKINDLQGKFGLYDIKVFVCNCVSNSNCERRGVTVTASGAIIVTFATLLSFLSLLLVVFVSSGRKFVAFEMDDIHSGTLVRSNTEIAGTDCTVAGDAATKRSHVVSGWENSGKRQGQRGTECVDGEATGFLAPSERKTGRFYGREDVHQPAHTEIHKTEKWRTQNLPFNMNQASHRTVYAWILRKLSSVQKAEDDGQEYPPHPYAEEGDADVPADLDVLTIPDDGTAFQSTLNNLTPEFAQLASICVQQHFGN